MKDITKKELGMLFKLAAELKNKNNGKVLKGKTIGLYFEKPSTRTKVSFDVGIKQLGGEVVNLNPNEMQISRGESIADTSKILSMYLDAIIARVHKYDTLIDLAKNASIPVINALSDFEHPCQGLADLFTVYEEKGDLNKLKFSWVGDGNNVCHSLIYGCAKTGSELAIATPKGYEPAEVALKCNKKVKLTNDPKEAVKDADVVATDTWISMGQEKEKQIRLKAFEKFQVNKELVRNANKNFIFMHCLPAYRGYEVSSEIIDGPHSVIWQEAENRLHTQKALLINLLKDGGE